MKVYLTSFGRKYGVPAADCILDVRCLKNPFWVPELRGFSGLDAAVRDYIFSDPESVAYVGKLADLLRLQVKLAGERGFESVSVAVGCTGGRHRSVAVAEFLAAALDEFEVEMTHRDIGKDEENVIFWKCQTGTV